MSLQPPPKVQKLQSGVTCQSEGITRVSVLPAVRQGVSSRRAGRCLPQCCQANGGAAGVDGQRFEDIEAYGGERWLGELAEELQRRRRIDRKPSGGSTYRSRTASKRPLGIPTIKDRVVQTAAVLVLEPIFEADLQPEQYAYRPDRSAQDAVERSTSLLNTGHTRGDRRGFERLLRQHSARRTDEIGGPSQSAIGTCCV